mmetsp:Transcript_20143/g.46940  ORF Transcript_20143/g.46940 Transcript_20143/m.46940 type:complete len:104 (-) Transcript_20143:181-492(-)
MATATSYAPPPMATAITTSPSYAPPSVLRPASSYAPPPATHSANTSLSYAAPATTVMASPTFVNYGGSAMAPVMPQYSAASTPMATMTTVLSPRPSTSPYTPG